MVGKALQSYLVDRKIVLDFSNENYELFFNSELEEMELLN